MEAITEVTGDYSMIHAHLSNMISAYCKSTWVRCILISKTRRMVTVLLLCCTGSGTSLSLHQKIPGFQEQHIFLRATTPFYRAVLRCADGAVIF